MSKGNVDARLDNQTYVNHFNLQKLAASFNLIFPFFKNEILKFSVYCALEIKKCKIEAAKPLKQK